MLHPPIPGIQVQPELFVPFHLDIPALPDVLRFRPPNAEHNRADPDHIQLSKRQQLFFPAQNLGVLPQALLYHGLRLYYPNEFPDQLPYDSALIPSAPAPSVPQHGV
jgi:hypothetical protein